MNNIRLSPYPDHFGVKTEVNGVELQEVCDIQLLCPVGEAPTLYTRQFANPGLDVALDGVVQPIIVMADESLELHVDHPTPTSTRYWVTRR